MSIVKNAAKTVEKRGLYRIVLRIRRPLLQDDLEY